VGFEGFAFHRHEPMRRRSQFNTSPKWYVNSQVKVPVLIESIREQLVAKGSPLLRSLLHM
jgi:hypothetical protein